MCGSRAGAKEIPRNPGFLLRGLPIMDVLGLVMAEQLPPSSSDTYNEEMKRWMAKQSIWWRLRYLQRHPEARPLPLSLLMLALKLVPVVLIGGFVYYVLLQRYLTSGDFASLVRTQSAVALNAEEVKLTATRWKAGKVSMNTLEGRGRPDNWVRRFSLTGIGIPVKLQSLFTEAWTPGEVSVQSMEVELRAGMLGGTELERVLAGEAAGGGKRGTDGKWGVKCDGAMFRTNRLICRDTYLSWGGAEESAGFVRGAVLDARRVDDGWVVTLTGGELEQGWLRGAQVDEIVLSLGDGRIRLDRCDFTLPAPEGTTGADGRGSMAGVVTVKREPEMDLAIDLRNTDITLLLPEKLRGLFAGRVTGECSIEGSTNRRGSVRTTGAFELHKEFAFGFRSAEIIPLLEVLGGEVADIPVRYFICREGGVRFALGGDKLQVDGLTWLTPEGERLEGQFSYAVEEEMIDGVFRVGVKEERLAERPELGERFFSDEGGGLRWLTVPVEDKLRGATEDLANQMRAVLREE